MPKVKALDYIQFKSLKVVNSMSEETLCFSANIMIGGEKIGHVRNHGTGGCNDYYWESPETQKKFKEVLAKWLKDSGREEKYDPSDALIDEAITETEDKKIATRYAKKGFAVVIKVHASEWEAVMVGLRKPEDIEPWVGKKYPGKQWERVI